MIGAFWIFLIIVGLLIFIFVKAKQAQEKIITVVLIVLIVFLYISYIKLIAPQNINLNSAEGLMDAGKIYIAWIGSVFSQTKTITGDVISNPAINQTINQTKQVIEQTKQTIKQVSRR